MTAIGDTGTTMIDRGADKSTRRTTYVVIAVVLLVLIVIGLLTRPAREEALANELADQLIAALEEAGVTAVPSREQIVAVLGDDGGAVCVNPASALKRGLLGTEIANGAAGPGMRPVIADSTVVRGEALIISIYCPDQLDAFEQLVRTMAFDDVINR